MSLGYDKPLYLLAFDHRASFERDLFHASPPVSDQVRAGIVDDAVHQIADHYVEDVDGYRLATGLTGLSLEEPWPSHPSD
jgi:hypothetical protein